MITQIFIDGQQKVEIGLKRKSKLKAELEVAMKKKKSFIENKNWDTKVLFFCRRLL